MSPGIFLLPAMVAWSDHSKITPPISCADRFRDSLAESPTLVNNLHQQWLDHRKGLDKTSCQGSICLRFILSGHFAIRRSKTTSYSFARTSRVPFVGIGAGNRRAGNVELLAHFEPSNENITFPDGTFKTNDE